MDNNKKSNLEKLNISETLFEFTRFFNRGYEGIITLGAYFKAFESFIDASPEYQRPYHYDDHDPETFGEPWQRNLIGDLLKGEKIPTISFRETDRVSEIVLNVTTTIKMFVQELLDGGHRSRTFYHFYLGLLKTPAFELSVNGRIYSEEVSNKFWWELPLEVREHALKNIKLNIDVFQNLTDTEAGMKFETLNNLHDMSAQEKRQWRKVQISKSNRDLSAIDRTKLKMYDRTGMKFKYVKVPVTGRVTDEIGAKLAYAVHEDLVKNNEYDNDNPDSFASLNANKAQLNGLYINGDKLHEEVGDYHSSGKTMTRVKDVMELISSVIYDNRTDDNMSSKYWTKSSILKLGLMFNEWMDKYGVESMKNMDTKLFWQKLSVLLRSSIKEHQFRAYSRYEIINGEVKSKYEKPVDKEVICGFSKSWGTGDRIDDFEWIKQTIEAGWNPADWGIIKLAKPFSEKVRQQIFKRDGYKCLQCGTTEKLEADHIKPREKGGESTLENGQTLCRSCNASKSNKISDETLNKLSDIELGDLFRNGKITLEQMSTNLKRNVA